MARLSVGTRLKIVILHQEGLSQTKISKETGVSRCAVQALLKKYKETGNVEDRRSSGRPRKLSAADERLIMLTSLRNQKMSSSDISSELAVTSGTLVHPSTVRRSLARSGLHGRIVDRKPYLGHGNKAKQVTGKKSIQAKEEKQKREEEQRAAMTAVYAKVQAANQLADPLETFSVFKKFDRNGLNLTIECCRVTDLDQKTIDWAFELTKANMKLLYEPSDWEWKQRETQEELTDERAWYLIARDDLRVPVAFVHFRFDVECGDEVLYCYEVQLEVRVRRKGVGKFLVQILQLMANSTQMKKVILTVFKHNLGAYRFFRNGLQFEIDETSPSVSGCCGDDCTYEILSRRTKFGDAPHSHSALCAGCLPLNEEADEDGEES